VLAEYGRQRSQLSGQRELSEYEIDGRRPSQCWCTAALQVLGGMAWNELRPLLTTTVRTTRVSHSTGLLDGPSAGWAFPWRQPFAIPLGFVIGKCQPLNVQRRSIRSSRCYAQSSPLALDAAGTVHHQGLGNIAIFVIFICSDLADAASIPRFGVMM